MHICHADGDRLNPAAANLRYDSPKANADDTARHGRRPIGEQHHGARLTATQAAEAKAALGTMTLGRIAAKLGVSISTINAIRQGRTWRHVG